jgi:hypothetical protein
MSIKRQCAESMSLHCYQTILVMQTEYYRRRILALSIETAVPSFLKKYVKGSDRYSGDKKKTRISIAKFLTLRSADGREKFVN